MSDVHLVPVRERDLDAVYELLAQRSRTADRAPSEEEASVEVPRNGRWSRSELEALHQACFKRNRAILARVAEASLSDTAASYGDLFEAARPHAKDPNTYGFNNLRADLAWVAKFAKKVKNGEPVWPMTVREADESHDKGDRYTYQMPAPIAQWWLEIDG